jgi:membrane-bound inhibitor of C-type lysozyme
MRTTLPTICLGSLLLLPAIVAQAQTGPIMAHYTCSDGTHLMATFTPPAAAPGAVDLKLPGSNRATRLPQALSADGGRYAAGDQEFWVKGKAATYTQGSKVVTCKAP